MQPLVARSKKIGILTDYLGAYQYEFLRPMQQIFSKHGFDILTFVGYELNFPRKNFKKGNRTYDFANFQNVDGLVVFGTISNYISDAEFYEFLVHKNLPVVVLGRALDGYGGVTANQETGMQALMDYLCDDCDYKNFAFIRGLEEKET